MKIHAVDVSAYQHNNGTISWETVRRATEIRAAIVKATEGLDYVNPWLRRDAEGAHRADLRVGLYHFAHPGESDPDAQARFFADTIKDLPRDLCVMLDLEATGGRPWGDLADWGKAFLGAFEGHAKTIVLYTNRDFLDNMAEAPWGHKLLFADPAGTLLRPRRQVWGWQYSWRGTVQGIDDTVDLDELFLEGC